MLTLQGVSKKYGAQQALAPIDLVVTPGEVLGLLGTSGSGKSTLLRLMIGLAWPDAGVVSLQREPLTPEKITAARLQMGYVIQEGGLFPHMTALQNVTLQARYLRRPEELIKSRVSALLALVRLPEGALEKYPRELSGGQRQRVSLMRALMLDPPLLLLDEPLGALDPIIRAELQEDLKAIFLAVKKTVVLVTHDVNEAALLCDTIILLHEGRVVQRGALADFVERPADPFVTRFFRSWRGPQ